MIFISNTPFKSSKSDDARQDSDNGTYLGEEEAFDPQNVYYLNVESLQEYLQNLSRLAESPGFLLLKFAEICGAFVLSSSIFQQIFQNPCAYTTPHVFS